MHIESYETTISSGSKTFTFISKGPKGNFLSIVEYEIIPGQGLYNLGFGILKKDGTVDDTIVLNNEDTEKILKTIANTAIEFSKEYPNTPIFLIGSTKSRTRLYQQMINKYYAEISQWFIIFGEIDGKVYEEFNPDTNYNSFIVLRKG